MIGLRSLRNRLAVVFGLIVLGAIGTIYLTVTPQLEERLRNQKLESLLEDAKRNVEGAAGFAAQIQRQPATPSGRCRRARSDGGDGRERRGADPRPARRAAGAARPADMDSAPDGGLDDDDVRSLALDAVAARRPVSSIETSLERAATRSSPTR